MHRRALFLDPDGVINMKAGAAAGIGLRVLIGSRDATTGELSMTWSPISAKRLPSCDLAPRRPRLICVPGIHKARRFNA
jgi:hypothetical protein